MIKLQDSNIIDILPEAFTSDPKNIALGYALQGAMRRLLECSRTTSVYAAIDVADDDVLDMLAAELDTQYYDVLLDVEAKRKLVKNTLIWYGKAGTPAAVEELITSVFGEGRVEEWFDYGGEPFYFKVYTNATFTEDMISKFDNMLEKVKNTRSKLETVVGEKTLRQNTSVLIGTDQIIVAPVIFQEIVNEKTLRQNTHTLIGDNQIIVAQAIFQK